MIALTCSERPKKKFLKSEHFWAFYNDFYRHFICIFRIYGIFGIYDNLTASVNKALARQSDEPKFYDNVERPLYAAAFKQR